MSAKQNLPPGSSTLEDEALLEEEAARSELVCLPGFKRWKRGRSGEVS